MYGRRVEARAPATRSRTSESTEDARPTDILVDAVQRVLQREHAELARLLDHAVVQAQLLLERQRLAELLALEGVEKLGAAQHAPTLARTPRRGRHRGGASARRQMRGRAAPRAACEPPAAPCSSAHLIVKVRPLLPALPLIAATSLHQYCIVTGTP